MIPVRGLTFSLSGETVIQIDCNQLGKTLITCSYEFVHHSRGLRSSYSKMSLDRAARLRGRLMPGSLGQACPRSKPGSSGHACPRSTPPLRFVSRFPVMRTTVQISPRTRYLASQSEQVIRLLCERHVQSQPRARQ
jgi:hypothetical protein